MHRLSPCFLLLFSFISLFSCTPTPPSPSQTLLYIYRFEPPALIEFSENVQAIREIPFSLPPHCNLFNIFSPPVGKYLAIELSCPNGQTVLFFDTEIHAITQPVQDSDSHFLAWTPDGRAAYLKIDSLGSPRVVRLFTEGRIEGLSVSEFTYDLAASSHFNEFTFTFSRGLGQGSELYLAERDGRISNLLYADTDNYLSFARFSPDGMQIAFVKTPDTQTPFTVGELWVMDRAGSSARKLADADAGHGYAVSWSPDGERLAFVVRENPEDEHADQSADALIGNIYIVQVESGALTQITFLENGRVESPLWSPDGNTLAFNAVVDDRMTVHTVDLAAGAFRSLLTEPACCPAWVRK